METQRIGWIGVGKMGAPMCQRLLDSGYPVSAFDTDTSRLSAIEAAGARGAQSFEELIRGSDILISTVPDDQALEAIVFGSGGLQETTRAGQLVIEMSTVSPALSARIAAALSLRAVHYLRAPVSGSTGLARAGQLTVFVSGTHEAYSRAEPLLQKIATNIVFGGRNEEARYLKLVVNSLVGATSALLAEALAFGRKGGLETDRMLEAITTSVVASPLIHYKRAMLVSGDFTPAFSVSQMIKDLDLVLETSRAEHVPMALVASIRQLYETAFARGLGERDFFVLYQLSESSAGLNWTCPVSVDSLSS